MSESKVVATKEQATEYIESALVNGTLEMKAACKELGWSFPRIRSRAQTICKKMGGTFEKTSRGVYYLCVPPDPNKEPGIAEPQTEPEVEEKHEITAAEAEAAIMGNLNKNNPVDPGNSETTEE
jgi:hypothetical protein